MGKVIRFLLLIALALPAWSQVHENVTVELIEVPVYVIGPDGKAIRGLTKDNFELRVNRTPTPIEYFDAVDIAAPRNEPISSRERRLYLFMFDRLYAPPGLLARAQKAAIDAVAHSNPDTDFFAVATYTSNHGVEFMIPFLSDHATVARAIATLHIAGDKDPLGLTMPESDRSAWIAAMEHGSDSGFAEGTWGDMIDAEIDSTLKGGSAFQDAVKQPERYRISDLVGNFGDLARRLAGLEGQKHVVVFSTGFVMSLVDSDSQMQIELRDMFNAFRAAGVFLDTVDVAGQRSVVESESLYSLGHDTGGVFIHNHNDLREGLQNLMSKHEAPYILAFKRRGSRSGSISVRVKGVPAGSKIFYREGFGKNQPTTNVDALQLVDVMMNDVPQTGMTLSLDATSSAVTLSLPNREILPQVNGHKASVQTLLYIFDDGGAVVAGGTKGVEVESADDAVVIQEKLSLPPGRYVAKAVARIEGTTSLGFARMSFTVE
jgi:VWFA-related protein